MFWNDLRIQSFQSSNLRYITKKTSKDLKGFEVNSRKLYFYFLMIFFDFIAFPLDLKFTI